MDINTPALVAKLKEPFPVAEHKERKLPGGGRWFYISWQTIRDRLEELFPLDWAATYSDPVVVGDYTVIRCQLTILLSQGGITREGVGNDKAYPELNQQGKAKTIGTPPERARADAFKNAAEEFGLGAYLDDQKLVIRYMQTAGDSRAYKFAKENDWLDHGLPASKDSGPSEPTSPTTGLERLSLEPSSLETGEFRPQPTVAGTSSSKEIRARAQPAPSEDLTRAPSTEATSSPINPLEVLEQTSVELKRVGWTNIQGRDHLLKTYGKRSRQQLTESELWDFLIYLRSQNSSRGPLVNDPANGN